MEKSKRQFIKSLLIGIDIFIIFISYIFAFFLRQWISTCYSWDIFPGVLVIERALAFDNVLAFLWFILPVWFLTLYFQGMYRDFQYKKKFDSVWIILKTAFYAPLIIFSITYILKLFKLSRLFLLFFVFVITGFLILFKIIFSLYMTRSRTGINECQNFLIVGSGKRVNKFLERIDEKKVFGINIFGILDYDKSKIGERIGSSKIIGHISEISDIIDKNVIDEVFFIVPRDMLTEMEQYILECETQGIKINISADIFNLNFANAETTDIFSLPFISFDTVVGSEWELFLKRVFDIVSSFFGIIILSPLLFLAAILIKLTSRGPVFFIQERVGLNGRLFKLIKFRTMQFDAEERKKELEKFNQMGGPVFKMDNDPRITSLGRFLRKTSIDELPQLVNVFNGNMSIVGPRPPLFSEVKKYDLWHKRRLSMRPGITCLWQIMGRNKITDFDEWMKLDLEYIDNWSLKSDFKILFKTAPVVLFGIGAK